MNQDIEEEPYAAMAKHQPQEDSSSIQLEIVSDTEAGNGLHPMRPNPSTSATAHKTDLFKARAKFVPTQRFRLEQPNLHYFYRPICSRAPEILPHTTNGISQYMARKQRANNDHQTAPPPFSMTLDRPKIAPNTIKEPQKQEGSIKKEVLAPPPFKSEKKAQKARLKNLDKYRSIQIRETQQQRLKKAVEEKLKRQYGNITALDRRKAEDHKLTDEEVKVWLKSDKQAPTKPDNKPLALSFMNQHLNSYAPLLRIILSHQFAEELIEPQTKKISTIFPEKDTYEKTFEFLIFNEAIACLHNCYEQYRKNQNSRRPVKVLIKPGATNDDGFFTFFVREDIKSTKDNDQVVERGVNIIRNLSLSKFNLVIITDSEEFDPKAYSTTDFSRKFTFMGCILTPQSKEQLALDIRMITMVNGTEFTRQRGEGWTKGYAFIFEKVSTFVREFLAVRNVQFCDLAQYIYNPPLMTKSNPTYVSKPEYFDRFFDRLQGIYNKTQFGSIKELSLRDKGIIMLQGPPGTGKTSTLLGVLAGQYHYLKSLGQLGVTKILVCTPSNTAIDHITKRIVTEGLISNDSQNVRPKVLRMGLVNTDNEIVRSVYLDYLCEKQLIESNKQLSEMIKWTIPEIKDKITYKLKEIKKVENALKLEPKEQLTQKLKKLVQKKNDLEHMAYQLRRKRVDDKSTYNQIQRRLVSQAQIILTTLSSSGSERLEKLKGQFACLIVDEAGQCTEPNLLISLQLNINKILLIGDPCQLPATTFSPDSNVTLFNRSMFERMIDAGLKPYFLDIQYRMTPQIRLFPSRAFYNGRLLDDQSVLKRTYPREIEKFKNTNVIFIDVKFGAERLVDKSYENEGELQVTTALIEQLKAPKLNIGVITPYKQQMRRLQNTLRHQSHVFINTIDSFQGQEKDIILISTVRASKKKHAKSLGFLIDERRINVALTRSKFLLVIIGNADSLGSNEIWNEFLKLIEYQKRYMRLDDREDYREGLRRLLKGELTESDKKCQRIIYNEFSKDQRRLQRQEINLLDFMEPTPEAKVSIPQQNDSQSDKKGQESDKTNNIVVPSLPNSQKQDDKWSVSAAQNNIDRVLKQMYGQKSFFDLLKELQ